MSSAKNNSKNCFAVARFLEYSSFKFDVGFSAG
jgi:hypothetical protein